MPHFISEVLAYLFWVIVRLLLIGGFIGIFCYVESWLKRGRKRKAVCQALSGLIDQVVVATTPTIATAIAHSARHWSAASFADHLSWWLADTFRVDMAKEFVCRTITLATFSDLNPARIHQMLDPGKFGHYRILLIIGDGYARFDLLDASYTWLGTYVTECTVDTNRPGYALSNDWCTQALTGFLDQLAVKTKLAQAFPAMG